MNYSTIATEMMNFKHSMGIMKPNKGMYRYDRGDLWDRAGVFIGRE